MSYSTPHDKNIYYFLINGKQNNTALSWLLLCRLLLPHNKKNKLAFRKGVALSSILTVQQNSFCSFREARKLICYSFWLWILIINYKYNLFPLGLTEQCCCPHNKYFTFDCENRCACFGIIPPWLFQMGKIHFHIRLSKFILTNPNKNINKFFSISKLKQTLNSENPKHKNLPPSKQVRFAHHQTPLRFSGFNGRRRPPQCRLVSIGL